MKSYFFDVTGKDALTRLDVFLSRCFLGEISREKIKRRILEGGAKVDGREEIRPGQELLAGQKVEFTLPERAGAARAETGELRILYQDEDMVVLNKPAGLSVHPSPGEPAGTLVNRLLAHFPFLAAQGGERPGIVHRLDRDTSGLMLAALNEKSRLALAAAFAARLPRKEYLALTYGVLVPGEGVIDLPLGRDSGQKTKMAVQRKGGRPARSDYRTLYADPAGRFSLLAVRIHTGRTHQIRVHLAHKGHPVIGDARYAEKQLAARSLGLNALDVEQERFLRDLAPRQLLHAWRLNFPHPRSGQTLCFTCPPPEEFFRAILGFGFRLQRVILTGNPGCGKSSVLRLLREKGVPVWSADEAVSRLYLPGGDGWALLRKLLRRFGSRFFPEEAAGSSLPPLDKKALFLAMRADDGLRREVEHLIHPLVHAERRAFFRNLEKPPWPTPLAAAEIPLYFESLPSDGARGTEGTEKAGSNSAAKEEPSPFVAGIYCPLEIRAGRLRETRGWPDSMIEGMENWQWPEAKKMAAADWVVDNSGPLEALPLEVEKLLRVLEEKRKAEQESLEQRITPMVF